MLHPTLYIFSGLPGAGKTTLARALASKINATYLRIDTIEQSLRDLCALDVQGEGYRLAYRVATDNLALGLSVIADSCNPVTLTRDEWEHVARANAANFLNLEIICSDPAEHRRRVETRPSTIPGHRLPTWPEVQSREYHPWDRPRLILDTAGKSEAASLDELLRQL